jgi:hypothetical protein
MKVSVYVSAFNARGMSRTPPKQRFVIPSPILKGLPAGEQHQRSDGSRWWEESGWEILSDALAWFVDIKRCRLSRQEARKLGDNFCPMRLSVTIFSIFIILAHTAVILEAIIVKETWIASASLIAIVCAAPSADGKSVRTTNNSAVGQLAWALFIVAAAGAEGAEALSKIPTKRHVY